jgi:hypothetical protein
VIELERSDSDSTRRRRDATAVATSKELPKKIYTSYIQKKGDKKD